MTDFSRGNRRERQPCATLVQPAAIPPSPHQQPPYHHPDIGLGRMGPASRAIPEALGLTRGVGAATSGGSTLRIPVRALL